MHAHVLTTDPPAPTSNIHITSTMNNTELSVVSFEWNYVSDGAPVNYSVTVNGGPENDTVSAVTVEMGVELTLRYNTEYVLFVEVINCAGSSSSSMFTFKLGKRDFQFRLTLITAFQSGVTFQLLPSMGYLKVLVRQREEHSL